MGGGVTPPPCSNSTYMKIQSEVLDMLFSIGPKTKPEELFNREKELRELENVVEKDRIIILDGLRRIGKTSLLKVFFHETDHFNTFIDCRNFIKGNTIDSEEFDNAIFEEIRKEIKSTAFRKILSSISGVSIGGIEVNFEKSMNSRNLGTVLNEIDKALQGKNKKFIIAFDEAQYLRFYGRGGKDFLYLMAYVYDNLKNIVFVLTGSEVGMLFDFLKLDDPDQPLYGRYVTEISLNRFKREQSLEYLKKGLLEIGVESTIEDCSKIVGELDGIVGYLSIFGYEIYRNGPDFKAALEKAMQLSNALVKKEINSLLQKSQNYGYVLKAIAFGMNRYSKIKKYIEANFGKIHDSTLSNILNSLVKQNFVDIDYHKTIKNYSIADPVIQKYCLSLSV